MEFVRQQKEEEEEEEEMRERETSKLHFLSCSSSSAKGFLPQQQQQLWLGKLQSHQEETSVRSDDQAATPGEAINFNGSKLQLMDLSLGNGYDEADAVIEREHMFDKVVTPSDVGKLNRLVIPKQHAERFFPLASSTNENGLLLSFEDRNGKSWRFRYSYWNSSQSYVMTKGWSRFVKEKQLDAGDIVSFERGVGELGKDRLYIDWRRRPIDALNPISLTSLKLPNQPPFPRSVRWASRLYSLPSSVSVSVSSMPHHHQHLQQLNYNAHPYHHHHHHHHHHPPPHDQYNVADSSSASLYYMRSTATGAVPQANQDVPVVHRGKTVAKRLRLFGVNMECSIPEEVPECRPILSSSATAASFSPYFPSLSIPPPQLRLRNAAAAAALPTIPTDFSNNGKSSFDF